MTATQKLGAYNTADTAVAGTSMNALTATSYAWGAEIDNSTDLFTSATLTLALSSAVTSVSPAYLSVFLVEPDASGNYTASSGNPGQSQLIATWQGPGGSLQYLSAPLLGRDIPPKFKIVIQNNLGVTLPATNTSVCSLRRFSYQFV